MSIRKVPMLINGQEVSSTSGNWIDVLNPATQEVVAQVPFATLDEVDEAVANAKQAFASWRKVSLAKRQQFLLAFLHLVRQNTAHIAELITLEHGKTLPDAEGEVGEEANLQDRGLLANVEHTQVCRDENFALHWEIDLCQELQKRCLPVLMRPNHSDECALRRRELVSPDQPLRLRPPLWLPV